MSSKGELARIALKMKMGEVPFSSNKKAHQMMRGMATSELRAMAGKPDGARDYKKEYQEYHGKPEQIKRRSERNIARRKLGLKQGDGKEVDHKKPLSKGGSNNKANLQATSRKTNRKKYNK